MKKIENRNFYDFYRPEEYLFSDKNIGYYNEKTGDCGIEGALIRGLLQFQQALDDSGIPAADFLLKYDFYVKDKYTVEPFVVVSCYDEATLAKVQKIDSQNYVDSFRVQLLCPWTSAKDLFVYAVPEDLANSTFDNERNLLVKEDGTPVVGWTCKIFAEAQNIGIWKEDDELGIRFKYDLALVAEEVIDGIHQDLKLTLGQI